MTALALTPAEAGIVAEALLDVVELSDDAALDVLLAVVEAEAIGAPLPAADVAERLLHAERHSEMRRGFSYASPRLISTEDASNAWDLFATLIDEDIR